MNIYCEWRGDTLLIKSNDKLIATVDMVMDEPCLTFCYGVIPSFTFGEIEYVMDNWANMPKS
jgi:hypothetical protein